MIPDAHPSSAEHPQKLPGLLASCALAAAAALPALPAAAEADPSQKVVYHNNGTSEPDYNKHVLANVRRHGLASMRPFLEFHIRANIRRILPRSATRQDAVAAEQQELGLDHLDEAGFANLYWYYPGARQEVRPGRR